MTAHKGAEGLAADERMSAAASEEVTGMVSGPDTLARPQSGWDPYEIWRTRVKEPSPEGAAGDEVLS
jgi:hypothetical protein